MYEVVVVFHYLIVALMVIGPAIGFACGQRLAAQAIVEALDLQPKAGSSLFRSFILGTALNETTAIIGLIMGIILFRVEEITSASVFAELGIWFAMGFPGLLVGFLAAYPQRAAIFAIARQPHRAPRIISMMMILMSMMQMSVILGLVIGFFVYGKIVPDMTIAAGIQMCAAGCTFGLSAVGPLLGMSHFTEMACAATGQYPLAHTQLLSFSFLSQALIETPLFLALVISMLIVYSSESGIIPLCAAALTMILVTFGPGIASGMIAHVACRNIGERPEHAGLFSYTSLVCQAIIDASVIYGLIVAVTLLVIVP